MAANPFSNVEIEKILPSKQKLIKVSSKDKIPKAFSTLVKNNIYSIPVEDENKKGAFIGFVDMVDIVACVVEILDETEILGEEFDLMNMDDKERRFQKFSAERIADLSKRNPMHPLYKKASLQDALKLFSTTGVHRLPLTKDKEKKTIENVLTQSAVIGWLDQNLDKISETLLNRTIEDLKIGIKDVIKVTDKDKAIEAFKLMAKNKINAVAIVDSTSGQLITSVSAKDIRVIESKSMFTTLHKPCLEFVSISRSTAKSLLEKSQSKSKEVKPKPFVKEDETLYYCNPNDTLRNVLLKLAKLKIHRIFIVDDKKVPIGVISLGDVLALFSL